MDDDQLRRLLAETREEISKAEGKASILLAGGSLATGTIISVLLSGDVSFAELGVLTKLLFAVCSLLSLAGLVYLGRSLLPRLRVNPGQHAMLGYFGHVVQTGSLAEFERLAAEPSDDRARLTNQIWTLSLVVTRKYRDIVLAFRCIGTAIVIGVLAYITNAAGI